MPSVTEIIHWWLKSKIKSSPVTNNKLSGLKQWLQTSYWWLKTSHGDYKSIGD